MCLIGEIFDDSSDDVCGAVAQNRTKGDKISIWTKHAQNKDHIHRIGYTKESVLSLNYCFYNRHMYKEKLQIHIHGRFTIQYQVQLRSDI